MTYSKQIFLYYSCPGLDLNQGSDSCDIRGCVFQTIQSHTKTKKICLLILTAEILSDKGLCEHWPLKAWAFVAKIQYPYLGQMPWCHMTHFHSCHDVIWHYIQGKKQFCTYQWTRNASLLVWWLLLLWTFLYCFLLQKLKKKNNQTKNLRLLTLAHTNTHTHFMNTIFCFIFLAFSDKTYNWHMPCLGKFTLLMNEYETIQIANFKKVKFFIIHKGLSLVTEYFEAMCSWQGLMPPRFECQLGRS